MPTCLEKQEQYSGPTTIGNRVLPTRNCFGTHVGIANAEIHPAWDVLKLLLHIGGFDSVDNHAACSWSSKPLAHKNEVISSVLRPAFFDRFRAGMLQKAKLTRSAPRINSLQRIWMEAVRVRNARPEHACSANVQVFDPPDGSFTTFMDWLTLLFWTVNVGADCAT